MVNFFNFLPFFLFIIKIVSSETYSEQLVLRSVDRGQINAYFQFRTFIQANLDLPFQYDKHNDIFPQSLLRLFNRLDVQEFHLSLTKGKWKYDRWGLPFREVASNAHLSAWFSSNCGAKDNWKKLTSFLSGQFCASISLISPTETVNPRAAFKPFLSKDSTNFSSNQKYGFVAALPQEAICTENLTPWTKKLLPCGNRKGLGNLLSATNVFDSQFISLSFDFRFSCTDLSDCASTTGIELTQNIAVVFDPPLVIDGRFSWTLNSLFDSPLQGYCQLATNSHVYIESTHLAVINNSKLVTPPTRYVRLANLLEKKVNISVINDFSLANDSDSLYAEYDLKVMFKAKDHVKTINLGIQYPKSYKGKLPNSNVDFSAVTVRRHARGTGVSFGGLSVTITNFLQTEVYATYLDIIPWYFRMYLHSLSIKTRPLRKINSSSKQIKPEWLHYEPAHDRIRPHHLEMLVRMPAQSEVEIGFDFDIHFLRWTEYPPDANHGRYISPASVTFYFSKSQLNEKFSHTHLKQFRNAFLETGIREHSQPMSLFTGPTLFVTSVPDMSMPYNTQCFIGTVIAFFFAPLFKLTTLRLAISR